MGKVKNSKKYRKKLAEKSQPLSIHDTQPSLPNESKNLSTDMASLDVHRRERACVILGNILANYSTNFNYFDKICSTDLLGKLCMRLVDSSSTVRLHAAGAVRNMTSSKFPVIAQRMVDAGIISTMISLVGETMSSPLTDTTSSYAEQLVTAISNLCAACEKAVNEILQRHFLDQLFAIIDSALTSPSLKAASSCCIYTASDGHMECCSYLYSNPSLLGTLLSTLSSSFSFSASSVNYPTHSLTRLYCVGSLSNIYLSFLSSDANPNPTLLTEARQRMQEVLFVVLSLITVPDEVFTLITTETIDGTSSTEETNNAVTNQEHVQQEEHGQQEEDGGEGEGNGEGEGEMEGAKEDDNDKKIVFIGSDVDRSWVQYFDVIEVGAEILANMACLVKNTVLSSTQEEEEYVDWSDDEESELKMEQIASNKSNQQHHSSSAASTETPSLNEFDNRSAVAVCIAYLEKVNAAFHLLTLHCQSGGVLTSPVMDLLVSSDRIFNALHNISFLVDSQTWSVLDLANALNPSLVLFSHLCDIFAGITLSNKSNEEEKISSIEEIHMWSLSPAISSESLESTLRSALFSCSTWILSLHSISRGNSTVLGLLVENDQRFVELRSYRLQVLSKVLTDLPLFDAMRPCFELISLLAEATHPNFDRPLITPQENQILTEMLLKRLSDPGAVISREGTETRIKLVDASTIVMESCISCLIDLHSSDDLEIYQIFRNLQTLELLRETSTIFRNKLKGESMVMERVEVQKCKETLLNLNRFIKYKASPPN